jgi:hypothetical protein
LLFRRSRRRVAEPPVVAFVVVSLGAFVGGFSGRHVAMMKLKLFESLRDTYSSRRPESFPQDLNDGPYLRGKILVISGGSRNEIDAGNFPPSPFVPRTPDEVGTIVYVDCRTETIPGAHYESEEAPVWLDASECVCDVALVDRRSNEIVGRRIFRGGATAPTIRIKKEGNPSGRGKIVGPAVRIEELNAFLEGLPRR